MTWLEQHRLSERYASDAEVAKLRGEQAQFRELYAIAAQHEESALAAIPSDKTRTYGIIAVSAVALSFKAAEYTSAKTLAYRCLASQRLPDSASRQIEEMLQSIAKEQANIHLEEAQMLVSLRGGAILHGGAPLDLIVDKSQKMRSLIYRATEYLKKLPHRRRGGPRKEVTDAFRTWIFQAEPGSYQFTVAVQKNRQLEMALFANDDLDPKQIIEQLSHILQSCSESPFEGLSSLVPEDDYRTSFLKLARDLTPTSNGTEFRQLDIHTASVQRPISLNRNSRYAINEAISANIELASDEEEVEIGGTLRALHLDDDWIRVVQDDEQNVRINRAGDEVDDRIGPMVNHKVIVRAAKAGGSLRFLDIELDE